MSVAAVGLEIVTGDGRALLAALALVAALVYAAACWRWPFTSCGRCNGAAKLRSPSGRNWRPCPRCKGRGSKLRAGRRAWGAMHNGAHKAP